jgi:hypothetical protein
MLPAVVAEERVERRDYRRDHGESLEFEEEHWQQQQAAAVSEHLDWMSGWLDAREFNGRLRHLMATDNEVSFADSSLPLVPTPRHHHHHSAVAHPHQPPTAHQPHRQAHQNNHQGHYHENPSHEYIPPPFAVPIRPVPAPPLPQAHWC